MSDPKNDDDFEVFARYAMCWRLVHMSVNRYESNPTGELLTVMTFSLLEKIGYHPTVSDLASITGLKKSSVSRYVTRQMERGYVTEAIDPADRRLRRLVPTAKGRSEEKWGRKRLEHIYNFDKEIFRKLATGDDPVSMLTELLLGDHEGQS